MTPLETKSLARGEEIYISKWPIHWAWLKKIPKVVVVESHVKAGYVYVLAEGVETFEIHARYIHRSQEKCTTHILVKLAREYKTSRARAARESKRIEQYNEFVIDMLYTSSREKLNAYRFVDGLSTTATT